MPTSNGLTLSLNAFTNRVVRLVVISICLVSAILVRYHIHHENINTNIRINDSTAKNGVWSEYDHNADQKSALLTQTSRLDFLQIEKILWRSKLDEFNQLKVNSATLELLEQIHALLPNPIGKDESERLAYLVKKSIPYPGGEQLAELIHSYNLYTQYAPGITTGLSPISETQRVLLLIQQDKDRVDRQTHFFGLDLAQKLFSKKNITRNYLNQRMQLNLDNSLSNDEKLRRLDNLQNNYRLLISKEP